MKRAAGMDSPANLIHCRNQVTETTTQRRSLFEKSSVEERSVSGKTRAPESVSDDLGKSLEGEEADGRRRKPERKPVTPAEAADSQGESSSFYRRGGGSNSKRKKGNNKKRKQHEEKSKEKLKVLVETLNPIPFKPFKTVDYTRYHSLLKTLGLWDFVHLEFDQCIHYDLLAQLIAYYSPEGRCSYVNGSRVNLSRAHLARALKLPNKKERVVILDEDKELLESDESIGFVDEIVSSWILLHCDDAWMMPDEVVEWRKGLKEKHLDKLDWAGLLWFMVEKELKAEPPLGDCFYASHMQMVIRSQKQDVFLERDEVEDDDVMVMDDLLIESLEEDTPRKQSVVEDVGGQEVNDDFASVNQEKCVEEVNLRQESKMDAKKEHDLKEQPTDLEKSKEETDEKCLRNEDSVGGSHFLNGCDVAGAIVGDEENRVGYKEMGENDTLKDVVAEEKTEEDTEKHEGGFPLFPNSDALHDVAQENLMLGDTSSFGYNSGLQVQGNSTGEFMASQAAMHMFTGGSVFGNSNKVERDHENDISYDFDSPAAKRSKTDGPSWDEKAVPFEVCMEQIKLLAEKAKLSYVEKDQGSGEPNLKLQMLVNELQRREETIQQLRKDSYEEQQRKDMEIYKLENEVRLMSSVLAGYRKALKETQKECRKHMKCCPLRYKEVKGSGGLVSNEKPRLEQKEEEGMRQTLIQRQVEECGDLWIKEYEVNLNQKVTLLEEKLIGFQNMVKLLKRTDSRLEVLDTPERCDAAANT